LSIITYRPSSNHTTAIKNPHKLNPGGPGGVKSHSPAGSRADPQTLSLLKRGVDGILITVGTVVKSPVGYITGVLDEIVAILQLLIKGR
jgi:hypothetical protein